MPLPLRIAMSVVRRPRSIRYGDGPSQRGDLHLPRHAQGPLPVAVVLHGGFWRDRYGKLICRPLALDLAARGWAVWNLEYRRLGSGRGGGGGWPMTFADVARGVDLLATLDRPELDLGRVAVVGHSAGGQLALWVANRSALLPGAVGAAPAVRPAAVVALSPVTDMQSAVAHTMPLLGGGPQDVPDRWQQVDPKRMPPPSVPVLVVHPTGDATIPVRRSQAYVEAARAAGADVELAIPPGEDHRAPIDPASRSWAVARDWLLGRP